MSDQQLTRATTALTAYQKVLDAGTDPRAANKAFFDAVEPLRGTTDGDRLVGMAVKFEEAAQDRAFGKFAKLGEEFSALTPLFNQGQQAAEKAKGSLLFPAVAAEFGRIAGVVKALKEAADTIQKVDIDALGESFSKGDIAGLLGQADDVTTTIQQLEQKLKAIQGGLPDQAGKEKKKG